SPLRSDARLSCGPHISAAAQRNENMTEAYIFDAIRSPRGKGRADGSLHEVTAVRLSADMLNSLKARNGLDGHAVEDVIWGNVTQVMEQGGCLARTAVLASTLDESIPGLSINRFCASGMEAVNIAANQVRGGAGQAYIAGGVEMMSRVAMGSDGAAIAADPSVAMDTYFVPQGISADIIATEYGFSRDDCDAFAVESQRRAHAAWTAQRFARSIVAIKDQNGLPILAHDEYMRPATDMQSLGGLKPAFQAMGEVMPGFDKVALMKYPHLERINHVHHAGNSSGIVDGAAAVLIGSKEFGEAHGLTPRARIRATAKIGTDPTIMLTGPVPVTEKILRDHGMTIGDIDLFEVNEAFSAVVLRFMQAFNVDHAKLNVNGGAIAMGHPLGATGAMIIGTLLDELERTDKEIGLATLCVASGMGAATIIERV
ncbi:MAG: acetyl-CoA C-acetyltransferase, partial [Paracoccaceae bacterium]